MARVKLHLPQNFIFSTEIAVRIGDINYGGHLGNDSVLSLVHEARIRFLSKYGFSEKDVDGVGLIMCDVIIVYKSESFYGDNLLVKVTLADFTYTGCDFLYRLSNNETDKEVARAKTGIVFYDYHNRKIVPIPRKFNDSFLNLYERFL